MKTLPLSKVRRKLGTVIDEVRSRNEPVTITRNGQPVAVLISFDEVDSWRETLSIQANESLRDEIAQGLAEIESGSAGLYTLEELFDQE